MDGNLLENIRALRVKKGLSQEDLAEKLGVNRSAISLIETGDRELSAVELIKIAEMLGVSVEELLSSTKEEKTLDKRIYFVRHGEAMDDVYNQYGGWADPELSDRGVASAYGSVERLRLLDGKYEIIYSSPLKRALQKSTILGEELGIKVKVSQFLKERNTYGLLCGIDKDYAKKSFPELVSAYEKGEDVLASEKYDKFVARLDFLIEFLRNSAYNRIICVTHGKLMQAIIKEFLGMNYEDLKEDCILVAGLDEDGLFYMESEGIKFKRSK